MSDQVFPYNITRNGSSTSYSANGYFQAIENLKEQHNDPELALTDEQKKQETKELRKIYDYILLQSRTVL